MNSFTTAIVSHQANEEGPEIINIIGVVLSNLGVVIDQSKMETAEMQNTELSFLESVNVTLPKAIITMKRFGLSEKEMAYHVQSRLLL